MFGFKSQLLPFEKQILEEIGSGLTIEDQDKFQAQIACINKVQRLLKWNEIEFYSMQFLKVHWPAEVLFDDTSEHVIGEGSVRSGDLESYIKVWAVGGHLFSIESNESLLPFKDVAEVDFKRSEGAI